MLPSTVKSNNMNKGTYLVILSLVFLFGIAIHIVGKKPAEPIPQTALAAKFDALSQSGNSSCSTSFMQSIDKMPAGVRLEGSCCSPMSFERYAEQVAGLKKFKDIPEIPPDPYDVEPRLAKNLFEYYDFQLTSEEQAVYDYAMEHSHEKGPCCCKCWRWYVYGGLAKKLIHERGFTGEQIVEVWNMSDGCGGEEEHVQEHHM